MSQDLARDRHMREEPPGTEWRECEFCTPEAARACRDPQCRAQRLGETPGNDAHQRVGDAESRFRDAVRGVVTGQLDERITLAWHVFKEQIAALYEDEPSESAEKHDVPSNPAPHVGAALDAIRPEIEQLRAERDQLVRERDGSRNLCRSIEGKWRESAKECDRIAAERDHARTRLNQSRAIARDLRQRLDAARAEWDALQARIDAAKKREGTQSVTINNPNSPPFKVGDWVRRKDGVSHDYCLVGRVERVWRDGGDRWSLTLDNAQLPLAVAYEPWQPRKGERVTGESCHSRSTYTGEYKPFYRSHAAPEGCVAVCTRPWVYAWVRRDSLRPAEGGEEQ